MTTRKENILSLFKSYITILEMLTIRGYSISNDYYMNFEEFLQWFEEKNYLLSSMTDIFYKRKKEDNKTDKEEDNTKSGMLTFWMDELRAQNIPDIALKIEKSNVQKSIIVISGKITPSAHTGIHALKAKNIHVETFTEEELQCNILKHTLVPIHVICSSKEKKQILEAYGITKEQIPHIMTTDPVCRFLGAKSGQLIKIVQKSTTMPYAMDEKGDQIEFTNITYSTVVN
jgi:DNA-directed RNA polymerase I, II, and III subunit RPABC1